MMYKNLFRILSERKFSGDRTKLMLDSTPLCCSLIDRECHILDCNEETAALYGLSDKREYMERFFDFSPAYQPDGRPSREKAQEIIKEAFQRERTVFEWTHQKPDGTLIPGEITLIRVKRGDDYVLASYTRDLREYKKMMAEIEHKDYLLQTMNHVASILLQSEIEEFEHNLWQCLRMMAEAVQAGRVSIWKNQLQEGRLYANQIYEWSENASLPQQRGTITKASYDDMIPGWEKALSAGHCINGIAREMTAAEQATLSTIGTLSVLVVPVFLRDQFWGFMGFDDYQRERHFSADEEAVLRSGSIMIASAMLRNEMTLDISAAVEAAQAASLAKSNFLSNMSHEIRTPITAIAGMTLIGKSSPNVEKKDYAFGKIEDASNHLLGVINDILDMSKIEANKFELSLVDFNFEKMLQRIVNVFIFRIDEKKLQFSVFLDKDIPPIIIGDDTRLAQIITNLLANAIKFTPEGGGIRLDTHLLQEQDGLCTIQIEVSDTGIGISPERQEGIFDPFVQAENTTSRKFGGTGLGLAVSKHITELMGGKIWLKSQPGQGSTFAFTIQAARGTSKSHCAVNRCTRWQGLRVLAIDDEQVVREYFANIAEGFGLSCHTALNGNQALALIEEHGPYDIYFIDWKMPEMNGIELARRIRTQATENPLIIMISASEWSIIEDEAKNAGIDKFLAKPLFPSDIADAINECLGYQNSFNNAEEAEKRGIFQGKRALLAEDVDINREIVLALFESTQLQFECAENGAEAVRMFKESQGRYDLILMDLQMPQMDGLEATRLIRGLDLPQAKDIPIIAMTANVFREDIEQCLTAGMNDHVSKPLDFDEMLSRIKHWLAETEV